MSKRLVTILKVDGKLIRQDTKDKVYPAHFEVLGVPPIALVLEENYSPNWEEKYKDLGLIPKEADALLHGESYHLLDRSKKEVIPASYCKLRF